MPDYNQVKNSSMEPYQWSFDRIWPSTLRNIQITHNNQTIDAAPYKLPGDDTLSNIKHIIHQNNFTNTNLNSIVKQLT
jgi:hypothetical protein